MLVIKNKSHAITAEVEIPAGGAAEGVIVAQGGHFRYATDGKPACCYNTFGVEHFKVYRLRAAHSPAAPLSAWSSTYDGGGLGKGGGRQPLRRRRARSATGRVEMTRADGLLGRRDNRCRVRQRHPRLRRSRARRDPSSPGPSNWVQIDIDESAEDSDHFITPEERMRIVMARQ